MGPMRQTVNGSGNGAANDSSGRLDDQDAAQAAADDVGVQSADEAVEVVEAEPLTPDQQRIVELQDELTAMGERLRQYAGSTDRMRAEFEASKARLEREHQRLLASEKVDAAQGLLAVLDNVDKALGSADGATLEAFVAGVKMIRADFEEALGQLGIVRFDANGERFDPERHQAVTAVPVTDPTLDSRVLKSITAGAALGDNVIRAAGVVVGRYVAPKKSEEPS